MLWHLIIDFKFYFDDDDDDFNYYYYYIDHIYSNSV